MSTLETLNWCWHWLIVVDGPGSLGTPFWWYFSCIDLWMMSNLLRIPCYARKSKNNTRGAKFKQPGLDMREITWDHQTVVLSSPVVSLVFFLHNLGIEFWFSGSFFWSLKNCGKPKRYLEWFILGLWCMGCGHSSCSNFEAKRLADFWARCCRWSGLSAVEVGGACGYKVATKEMASLVGSWLW